MGGRGGPGRNSGVADWRDVVPATEGNNYPERRPITNTDSLRARAAEQAILDAIPGLPETIYSNWRTLTSVRDALSRQGFSVSEQDAGIYRAALNPRVRVVPVANLKIVGADQRRGSIHIGGEWKHIISLT